MNYKNRRYEALGLEGKETEFEVWQTMLEASQLLLLIRRQAYELVDFFDVDLLDSQDLQEIGQTITTLCESWDARTKAFLQKNGLEFFESNMMEALESMPHYIKPPKTQDEIEKLRHLAE